MKCTRERTVGGGVGVPGDKSRWLDRWCWKHRTFPLLPSGVEEVRAVWRLRGIHGFPSLAIPFPWTRAGSTWRPLYLSTGRDSSVLLLDGKLAWFFLFQEVLSI